MKKTYIIPKERVIDLELEGQLLSDSNPSAGSYDGSSNPGDDGDGMDEDNPVRSQRLWDGQW